jgi:hypothetical protein
VNADMNVPNISKCLKNVQATPIILALRRGRQKDREFEASLGYTVSCKLV